MNYELAKKLKDAGFPQTMLEERYKYWLSNREDMDRQTYLPDLSELIEACGDRFMDLRYKRLGSDYDWYACGENLGGTHCLGGSTPEEAVANLWLKLNET